MKRIQILWTVCLGALLTLGSGCASVVLLGAGAAAGVAGVAYVNGELKATLDAPLDRSYGASQAAIKDLQFTIKEQAKDALTGRIESKTANDRTVQIKLAKLSDKSTEVRIRVGTFGDEALSRTVFDKIKSRL